jgi:hypothetical protein
MKPIVLLAAILTAVSHNYGPRSLAVKHIALPLKVSDTIRDPIAGRVPKLGELATVLVSAPGRFSAGTIIDAADWAPRVHDVKAIWLLTSDEIVADAPVDPKTATREIDIILGKRDNVKCSTRVYKVDHRHKLALLRLDVEGAKLDSTWLKKNVLPVRKASAYDEGGACVLIGHSRSEYGGGDPAEAPPLGWQFAEAQIHAPIRVGQASRGPRLESRRTVGPAPGPGFAGGPLLDANGKLIGITYAEDTRTQLTSHINLEEIQAFLQDWPIEPAVIVPEFFSPHHDSTVVQVGRTPVLLILDRLRRKPVGLVANLDSRSILPSLLDQTSGIYRTGAIQFGFIAADRRAAFYKFEEGGEPAQIRQEIKGDPARHILFTSTRAGWVRTVAPGPLVDPTVYRDPAIATHLRAVLEHFQKAFDLR